MHRKASRDSKQIIAIDTKEDVIDSNTEQVCNNSSVADANNDLHQKKTVKRNVFSRRRSTSPSTSTSKTTTAVATNATTTSNMTNCDVNMHNTVNANDNDHITYNSNNVKQNG